MARKLFSHTSIERNVTVMAVRGDTNAEGEAVAYCSAAGFETLTR